MKRRKRESGAALVEFALLALVLYLLVAGGVELGRMIFLSQVLQDAARLAARELAVTAFDSSVVTFEDALASPLVTGPTWDATLLVVDLGCYPDPDGYFSTLPVVNRALRPAFISETVTIGGSERRLLRYPGALLHGTSRPCPGDPANPNDLVVGVPRVATRDANGVETIEWIPILAEVRANAADPSSGPFVFNPPVQTGIVALAINYPFQSAAMSGFRRSPGAGVVDPNAGNVIRADDAAVTAPAPPNGFTLANPPSDFGPYSGPYGLGNQAAFAQDVRPFRRLLLGQAIFRREVIQ